MRLRQALAFRRSKRRELTAPDRLVHAVAHHPRLPVLRAALIVPMSLGTRLVLAVVIEASWEVLENTPFAINRYREATIALDYYGDSVINSMSDILFMVLGFFLAWRLPVWLTVTIGLALEIFVGAMIRDNLTLNVIMFLWPLDSILHWQQAR